MSNLKISHAGVLEKGNLKRMDTLTKANGRESFMKSTKSRKIIVRKETMIKVAPEDDF